MRIIESKQYVKDCKKVFRQPKSAELQAELIIVLAELLRGNSLPVKYRDHLLAGNWQGYRDCHIKPNTLLIYKAVKTEDDMEIRLARLASHSEIFD